MVRNHLRKFAGSIFSTPCAGLTPDAARLAVATRETNTQARESDQFWKVNGKFGSSDTRLSCSTISSAGIDDRTTNRVVRILRQREEHGRPLRLGERLVFSVFDYPGVFIR